MAFKMSLSEQLHFARKDIDRRREIAKKEHEAVELERMRKALAEKVMVDDSEILNDLIAIGFDENNVGVLPLVPLICVAWADGEVQSGEAKRILELAERRGLHKDDAGYKFLHDLLADEPESDYLNSCLYVLREFYETLDPTETDRAKRNLLGFSYVVAKAAGGVFGLFGNRVSDEEQEVIEEIAGLLGVKESKNTQSVHGLVAAQKDE